MHKAFTVVALALLLALSASAQRHTSTYTSTDTRSCRTIESTTKDAGYYRGRCPGVGGYALELIEGDIRQTLNVITPAKKKFELNFWQYNSSFSAIGEKVEWRLSKGVPVALIARFNVSDPEDSAKQTSFLIVSKISRKESCVAEIIDPQKDQNQRARDAADTASSKPCLQPPN